MNCHTDSTPKRNGEPRSLTVAKDAAECATVGKGGRLVPKGAVPAFVNSVLIETRGATAQQIMDSA